jgi:peroxiredoxin (alkyl hydroperoxide reductase subunit C)
MAVLVSKQAPDFTAQAVLPDGSFKEVKLHDYRGRYVVLFFYPLDFTFVCPSEIIAFDKQDRRVQGAQLRGHRRERRLELHALGLANTARDEGRHRQIQYPIVEDLNKSIARELRRALQ